MPAGHTDAAPAGSLPTFSIIWRYMDRRDRALTFPQQRVGADPLTFLTRTNQNNLRGPTAKRAEASQFGFVGISDRAKARYNFHKAWKPAWQISTICYGL